MVLKPLEAALRNLLEALVAGEPQRRANGIARSNSGPTVDAVSAAANAVSNSTGHFSKTVTTASSEASAK